LSNSSLPELEIQAAPQVKAVCSSVSIDILRTIARTEPLLTECLDDLVTSETRAIENSLFESGFNFFSAVLQLFKHAKTVNELPLLELYDSQFSIALRFGFTDFSFSGQFLFDYLSFHEKNLREHPDNFLTVLNSYISGFENCQANSDSYFAVASLFCDIARSNAFVRSKSSEILPKLETSFQKVVKELIQTFKNGNSVKVSVFRAEKAHFYGYLLMSFVWLHAAFGDRSLSVLLLEFLVNEIEGGSESWRVVTAVNALSVFFEHFPADSLSLSAVQKSLNVVVKTNSELLPQFLKSVTRFELDRKTWQDLLTICLENCFDFATLARLLGRDPDPGASLAVVERVFRRGSNDPKSLALLTLTIRKSWRVLLRLLLEQQVFDVQFRLTLLRRVLKAAETIGDHEVTKVADILFVLFKRGGMTVLADLVIERPGVAYAILSVDGFQRVCLLCERDQKNCPAFLQFLALVVERCPLVEGDREKIAATALRCVVRFGVEVAAPGLRLGAMCGREMRGEFGKLSGREQQMVVQAAERCVAKSTIRKNALNLKQFGERKAVSRKASSDDDEWETLETD
jgi:hypothetical protein